VTAGQVPQDLSCGAAVDVQVREEGEGDGFFRFAVEEEVGRLTRIGRVVPAGHDHEAGAERVNGAGPRFGILGRGAAATRLHHPRTLPPVRRRHGRPRLQVRDGGLPLLPVGRGVDVQLRARCRADVHFSTGAAVPGGFSDPVHLIVRACQRG